VDGVERLHGQLVEHAELRNVMKKTYWLLFLGALLVACSGASSAFPDAPGPASTQPPPDASTPPTTQTGLPCDVARVLHDVCQACHSAPPALGAPMPLVTYDDTQAPSKSNPAEPVWQRMKARLHDPKSPMPPTAPLAPSDLAALDAWLGAGAPRSDATCSAPPTPDASAPSGPDALPCPPSEQKTFLAHGSAANGKFHVDQNGGNEYACFTWSSPFGAPTQATAFAPVIDDKRVVHHWILYESKTQQPDGQFGPCNMPTDARFVAGWAPGGGNTVLPPDVGQDLQGTGGSFILQLHYWNVAGYSDANDASGVAMCTTTTPRAHAAAVVALGTLNISIPPHTADYAATATCTDKATSEIHIISTAPHMHTHGTSFKTEIARTSGKVDTLVDVPNWDFNNQAGHQVDMLLEPGDVLKTQCHYANTGDATITFGERTEDEMCFNFVLVWPVSAISSIFGTVTYCND
jgi:hypothetical protein